jgi:dihydropteroate synthase
MELRLGTQIFLSGRFAVMTEGVTDGADIAEVAADPEVVRAIRAAPGAPVIAVAPSSEQQAVACVRAGADLLAGDAFAGVAAATGAALLCSAPERAAGVRADGVLIRATDPSDAERLAEAGQAVFVDEMEPAVAAVFAWAGARVFRTADVEATRQVLDMVASISGTRPPAVSRRGLA